MSGPLDGVQDRLGYNNVDGYMICMTMLCHTLVLVANVKTELYMYDSDSSMKDLRVGKGNLFVCL